MLYLNFQVNLNYPKMVYRGLQPVRITDCTMQRELVLKG